MYSFNINNIDLNDYCIHLVDNKNNKQLNEIRLSHKRSVTKCNDNNKDIAILWIDIIHRIKQCPDIK